MLRTKQNVCNLLLDPAQDKKLADKFEESVIKFSMRNLTLEIFSSLLLASFYFGTEANPNICFDMKLGFNSDTFKDGEISFNDLEKWVESDTAIDCYISDQRQEFKFQIKSFPEKYKTLNTKTLVTYIKELSQKKYGGMSDVILTLVPQVKTPFSYLPVDLKVLGEKLSVTNIGFKEVVLLLNVYGKDSLFRAFKK